MTDQHPGRSSGSPLQKQINPHKKFQFYRKSRLEPRGVICYNLTSMKNKILILDFGSQYTQLIARCVRELGVFSEIQPYNYDLKKIRAEPPAGIILSGGPASITVAGAPLVARELFKLRIPILGICYGMQLITQTLGGRVERSTRREYGKAELLIDAASPLFQKVKPRSTVWMSHGDSCVSRLRDTRSPPIPGTAPSPPSKTGKKTFSPSNSTPKSCTAGKEKRSWPISCSPSPAPPKPGA